tara:strand:- start:432 stop:728 length:297 start_codon:yes stop_codon:yes gene_type:complete
VYITLVKGILNFRENDPMEIDKQETATPKGIQERRLSFLTREDKRVASLGKKKASTDKKRRTIADQNELQKYYKKTPLGKELPEKIDTFLHYYYKNVD